MTPVDGRAPRLRSAVFIGPESTGKTTLALRLAAALGAPGSLEYAREYAESHAPLGPDDVEPIARGQLALEDAARAEAAERGSALVLHDTDLVSTVVYARHYYGFCPAWVEHEARARLGDLYLLCLPDVPWVDDDVRDRDVDRIALLAEFRAALESLGARVVEVGGEWVRREAAAVAAVQSRD